MRALVLVIDGLQTAFLGPYGCEWVETPTLDRWAAAGVVFDGHFADGVGPDDFRCSVSTGRHALAPLASSFDLAGALNSHDVLTARVGPPLPPDYPFVAGWDFDLSTKRHADEPLDLGRTRRTLRRAIENLGDAGNALLWVEIDALLPPWMPFEECLADLFGFGETQGDVDDHEAQADNILTPWVGPLPEFLSLDSDHTFVRLQHTYAAAVASLDTGLKGLLGDCAKHGWGHDVLWVLTSGRGLPLGEHGAVDLPSALLHEETVHLPLLIRWPNEAYSGSRITALTQTADLSRTLQAYFGATGGGCVDPLAGHDLGRLVRGDVETVRQFAIIGQRRSDRMAWGMRTADWYLVLNEESAISRRLFVKPGDRWEVNNVYESHAELAEEMEKRLMGIARR